MANAIGGNEAFALAATLTSSDDLTTYVQYTQQALRSGLNDRSRTLSHIPRSQVPSYGPLATLSALLQAEPRSWPIFELQQCFTKSWKALPEEAKASKAGPQAQQLIDQTLRLCKSSYSSMADLFHASSSATAMINPENGQSLSHSDLAACVSNFRLPVTAVPGKPKPVVAISLPNGPLLGLTVLSTATFYTAAPVAHGSGVGAEQFKTDVLQSQSNVVLAAAADVERLGLRDPWLAEAKIEVCLVELSPKMTLELRDLDGNLRQDSHFWPQPTPNTADDIGIMLFTSGTSGTKKLVPLFVHSLVCGAAMVIESWGLSPTMRCLNQMPLNHVGGLVRNLFAPVMSGGSVICCAAFDANLFWDCVEDHAPTWYYASPSMHQGILEAGADRPETVAKSTIRLICNAAGGLLPSLAWQLKDTFSVSAETTVLPSYGMTECMPISTPPLDYKLDRTGTSGVSVGPEISILDGNDKLILDNTVGRIAVRGSPVFSGYLKNNVLDKSCFTEMGWFDTGDMGYLDQDGYLYITGRSKEVINRGGELISPFEVEEAVVGAGANPESPVFGRISKALAFSVTHDVLQEVVGIAVVTPEGSPRADLRSLQEAVKSTLSSVKIPVLMVFMDAGVPTNNNKVLRIKLAERLGLPEISDNSSAEARYYEADCPPVNTPLKEPIGSRPLQISFADLTVLCRSALPNELDFHVREDETNFHPELLVAPKSPSDANVASSLSTETLLAKLAESLHGFLVPRRVHKLSEPFPRDRAGSLDGTALAQMLNVRAPKASASGLSSTEEKIAGAFSQILNVPMDELDGEGDFFDLGGDSMKAGRLLSALRKEFQIRLAIDALFTSRKISALAELVESKMPKGEKGGATATATALPELLPGLDNTCSSTNPFLMFLQLLPIGLMYPMKRALTWTIFMYCLSYSQNLSTNESIPGRLLDLCVSMAIGRVITKIVAPCVSIAVKWMLIGRYKQGLYPMWGSYHTRWWFTQKVVEVCGMGLFSIFPWSRILYFRLMGVKIGKNVSIAKGAALGEYDLITIGDNVTLERCKCRPFAAERNTSMYLGRITIGNNASIGLASNVAAGTTVPEGACIGPNSSSWEASDADEANRDLVASRIPKPHWTLSFLLGYPITAIVTFCGAIPWLAALIGLVSHEPEGDHSDLLRIVLIWFSSPSRVGYHYLALAANSALGPAFFFAAVLTFKKIFDVCCGTVKPGDAAGRSNIKKFRMELIRDLMPAPRFHKLTEMFGSHYEATSIFARMMGAKVGKRVYWPGTGPTVQDWDLIEIGNDVVFGSRSHLVTSDGTGSDRVKIGSGSMVADRVVLLPGVELGEKAVMGSGALTKRHGHYPAGSTWVGAKKNEAICLSTETPPAPTGPTLGRRAEMYYDLTKAQPPIPNLSVNSSTTTLVKQTPFDSERSSLYAVEEGHELKFFSSTDFKDAEKANAHRMSALVRHVTVEERAGEESDAEGEDVSSSPFGRAFYQGQASYKVWGQFTIFCYATLITVLVATYWNVGSIAAVQVVGHIVRRNDYATYILSQGTARPVILYFMFTALIVAIMGVQAILAILFVIAAKWTIIGRRVQGNYDWDKSSYCQRWQLFLKIESFRRHCYGGHGILGLLTGTEWVVMYFRALGANIGSNCSIFASGTPSLYFTEPDLLTLGNRVCVDDASLVGHINTRGKFDLNPLFVGDRSVLRSGSRLLSGARMEADSCLLEHTLVMAGDIVDEKSTSQGWPAEEFRGNRMPTLKQVQRWALD